MKTGEAENNFSTAALSFRVNWRFSLFFIIKRKKYFCQRRGSAITSHNHKLQVQYRALYQYRYHEMLFCSYRGNNM